MAMRLDRKENRRGKYALIKLRNLPPLDTIEHHHRECYAVPVDAVVFGDDPETEFFAVMLRDKYAAPALTAYGLAAEMDGEVQYGRDVMELGRKAAKHKSRRKPD